MHTEYLKRNAVFILFAILFILLILMDTAGYNIKVNYGVDPLNESMKTSINIRMETAREDDILSNENIMNNLYYCGIINSSQWTRGRNDISFIIEYYSEKDPTALIRNISFRFFCIEIFKIDHINYTDVFENAEEIQVSDSGDLIIDVTNGVSELRFKSDRLIELGNITEKINMIRMLIILSILLVLFSFIWIDHKSKSPQYHKWIVILTIMVILVTCLSVFGTENASPDEDVSSESVKYYYKHWGLPDYLSEDAIGTISNYGSSRLKEITPYYFVAGKLGTLVDRIVGFKTSYRFLNLAMFYMLFIYFIKNGKRDKWLLAGMITTPQLWYIFASTTSDAWDYFISYIIVLALIKDGKPRKRMLFSIFRGVMFFLLFCGKQNYYTIALFSFLVYLVKLIKTQHNRKQLMKEYIVILFTAGVLFGGRRLLDYYWYSGEKQSILSGIWKTYNQRNIHTYLDQGRDLAYVLTDTVLLDLLYKSFVGLYGWMYYQSGIIYYCAIGIAYISFIVYIAKYFRNNRTSRVYAYITTGMIAFSFILVLYHCWARDFQPQGRYMFPAIPCVMYLVSQGKALYRRRTYGYLMQAIVLISLYSFVRYGMLFIM